MFPTILQRTTWLGLSQQYPTPCLVPASVIITSLSIWQHIKTNATYRRKSSLGTYSFRGLESMTFMAGSMAASWHPWRWSSIQELTFWDTSIKHRELPGNGVGISNLKAFLKWHTSSNKAILLNPAKQFSHLGTKHSNIWTLRVILIKTTKLLFYRTGEFWKIAAE